MTTSRALFPAVTVKVVRDRKIRTALRTNQIARFVIKFVIGQFVIGQFNKPITFKYVV